MAIQSLQQVTSQYYGNHICEKAYQNQVVCFIIINHFFLTINKCITFTSQKIAGNFETKIAEEKRRRRMEVQQLTF